MQTPRANYHHKRNHKNRQISQHSILINILPKTATIPKSGLFNNENKQPSISVLSPAMRGRERAASAPGQGGKNIRKCSVTISLRKKKHFCKSCKNVIFSLMFGHVKPWHQGLFILSPGVAHSFCDLAPPSESHMRENNWKNTVAPNEFTDFEKFDIEHLDPLKTI